MIETALVELIDRATAECAGQQRLDLHNRLRQIRSRVLDPAQLVLVIGESKQGKSELINSVVNAPVCNAGNDVTTAVPTIVRHSEEASAQLIQQDPSHDPAALDRLPVPIEQVHDQVDRAVADGRPITRTEINLPRAILKNGLVLMDTPGFGSVSSSLTATTQAAVAEADSLIMVSDATQELTTNELGFLRQAAALCPNVALVQPKTDIAPQWRQVVEVNRKHLSNAGIAAKIFPVSSKVRVQATSARDPDINVESGFPPLLEYLRTEMANKHEEFTRKLVSHNITDALDQLMTALREELSNQNPRTATETLVELESAQHRAEELKRVAGRWQKTLSDGIQELYSDIEHDFRERSWAILHQVNETLDEADPNRSWEDFAEWLSSNLSEAIAETFGWLDERRERLTEQVADELLREHVRALPNLDRIHAPDPLDRIPEPTAPRGSDFPRKDQILTGLRGSYGGVLMFGLITSMAGLPLMNVVSISAGLLLGSKSLSEEKDARLKRRQAEARATAQRYVDHVTFQVNKEARDTIRNLHQRLHEHCNRVTEQAQIRISQSIQDIKREAERSAVDRDERAREIKKKLEELTVLRKRATMLTSNSIAAA
ncbi:dynamin family protein [Haloactinomyces albus]|uniref:GTPase Era involved in 16S rRNA processing/predicted transcriptional regulator n=1 Tax=Haloactinomyces albus TaxID=1352928 RepID=A0AAE3ZBB4_9ACTN|nr:dynamin family protein [Haloactinomyces albus]MDR7301761.1 GTPase Era involved in 16S rRNA processing/predicted transcriptional regulator [Haloactinomyces albus]